MFALPGRRGIDPGAADRCSIMSTRSDRCKQIDEGTNQIQRVVIAKRLLGWLSHLLAAKSLSSCGSAMRRPPTSWPPARHGRPFLYDAIES